MFERYGIKGLVQRVLRAAEIILKHKLTLEDTESFDMQVIRGLLRVLEDSGEGYVPVREITEVIRSLAESEGEDPSKINSRKVGRVLGKLGLDKRRRRGLSEWYIEKARIMDLAMRYGVLDIDGDSTDIAQLDEQGKDQEKSQEEDGPKSPQGAIRCPYCGSEFVSIEDFKAHLEGERGSLDPVLTATLTWEREDFSLFEAILKRAGAEGNVMEMNRLRKIMDDYKGRDDIQGWINYVYSLAHEYVLVRFRREVPAFTGADMMEYGPFRVGDLAKLPKENAEALLAHGAVELVEEG